MYMTLVIYFYIIKCLCQMMPISGNICKITHAHFLFRFHFNENYISLFTDPQLFGNKTTRFYPHANKLSLFYLKDLRNFALLNLNDFFLFIHKM